jgi:hypothetical protein
MVTSKGDIKISRPDKGNNKMILQVTGTVYATFNPVIQTINVPLSESFLLKVEHFDEMTIIRIREEEYYFEKDSIIYQLI